MKLHWHRFGKPGLPVEFVAIPTRYFRWTGIYGLQIGPWFIGVVKGGPGAAYDPASGLPRST